MIELCTLGFCTQLNMEGSPYCFYHDKMLKGLIDPFKPDLYMLPENGDFWKKHRARRETRECRKPNTYSLLSVL